MTPARRPLPPEQQFPHLHAQLSGKAGWVAPVLAVAAIAAAVVATAVFVPLPDSTHDFRKESPPPAATAHDDGYEPVRWSELIPAGWDPSPQIRRLQDGQGGLADTDPRARASLGKVRALLDAAPAEPALEGRRIRIPGYVVPLDGAASGASEFLLVPYFGACIHTPPPPANQVIHVVASRPMKRLRTMEAVWLRGTLRVVRHDAAVATSGYRLLAESAEPYEPADGQ